MTKEELEKEAKERADEYTNLRPFHIGYEEGYFDGAEPREKHITELEKENAELKQAEKGKVVEHFEAYGQCRDSRRIAELEKENERLTVSYETLKLHDEEEIGMLKSENAELKTRLNAINILTPELQKISKERDKQLTKAKDILQRLMENQPTPSSMYAEIDLVGWREVNKEAEQFLSEVEK